jgi:uncharacterized membrane protein
VDVGHAFLRLLHVGLGVFWAGTVFFTTFLLMPAMKDAGPDGAKVMAALQRRGMLVVLPVVALITIVSGFWLYFRSSGGNADWARSPTGMALGLGGVTAVLSLIVGFTVMRPTQAKLTTMAATLATTPEGPDRAALAATMEKLRRRMVGGSHLVAFLLVITVVLMAVARYL